jgi:hypothetical protein
MGWRDDPIVTSKWANDPVVGQDQPAPQPQPEPLIPGDEGSWLDDAWRWGTLGAQGVNQGLTQMGEIPYDLVNNAGSILDFLNPFSFDKEVAQARGEAPPTPKISQMAEGVPVIEQMFPGEDPYMDIMDNLGLTHVVEPATPWEKIVERGGEEVGASLLPLGAVGKRAGTLAREGKHAQDMDIIDRAFVAPFKDAPARTAVAEATSAFGAGVGAQAANNHFGEDNPLAELIGATVGGVVAPFGAGAGRAGWEGLKSLASDESFARKEVGRRLTDEASDPRVLEMPKLRSLIDDASESGIEPTLGQATNDPGLKSLEYGRLTGPNKGRYAERRAAQSDTLKMGIEDTAPLDATDDSFLSTLDAMDADRVARFTDEQAQAIEDAAMWLREGEISAEEAQRLIDEALGIVPDNPRLAAETASTRAAGRVFGDAEDSIINQQRAVRNELYGQVPDDVEIPTTRAREAAQAVVDDIGRAGDPPPGVSKVAKYGQVGEAAVDPFSELPPPPARESTLPMKQVRDDLTTLGDDATAAKKAGRPGEARKIAGVKQAVREDLATAGEANEALARANQNDTENYAPRFREGVPAQVRAGSITDDKYLARALKDPVEADRLAMTIEGDEAAQTAVRDWMIADLGSGGSQNLTPAKVDKWLRDNGAVLERFPEVRGEVQRLRNQLGSGTDTAARARGVIDDARKLSDEAMKMQPEPADPTAELYRSGEVKEDRIRKIIDAPKSRERLRELVNMTGSGGEDLDGLKRGFVDLMMRGTKGKNGIVGADGQLNPGAAKNFLRDYADHIDILYQDNPQHARDIKKMLSSVEIMDRVGSSRARGTTGTGASGSTGSGVSGRLEVGGVPVTSLMSRIFAAESGRTSYRFVVSESLGQIFARARAKLGGATFERILDEAMLNPEFAAMLAADYTKDLDRKATKTLGAILLRSSARVGRDARLTYGDEEEEQASE